MPALTHDEIDSVQECLARHGFHLNWTDVAKPDIHSYEKGLHHMQQTTIAKHLDRGEIATIEKLAARAERGDTAGLTKDDFYQAMEMLAAHEQAVFPSLTRDRAIAKILGTALGMSLYGGYNNAAT